MGNFDYLDEIYFSGSDRYKTIQSLLSKKLIKKIAPEIYTSRLDEDPEIIIKRNIFKIIAEKFPGSVISHRSAFELAPFNDNLFLTSKYSDKYHLPGLTINMIKGPGPIEGDNTLFGAYYSQRERAFLENLQISKSKPPKCLSGEQVEEKLEILLRTHGEEYLNQLRDKARTIAFQLTMDKEFSKLDSIIGAMMQTKSINNLKSDILKARVNKVPYDINRVRLFEKLFLALHNKPFKRLPDQNTSHQAYKLFAFFESFFSNYIEGTKFMVEDAKQIIDSGLPMPTREDDSHDILGTYKIISNKNLLSITPDNPSDFIELLKYRHSELLKARKNFKPGMFKEVANMAGNTVFVEPELVIGTLTKGYEYYNSLQEPFAKAAYIMFLISEIHPFNDGNGRIARAFMNSELTKDNQSKILITTFFRDDYILALKKLTNQHDPNVYIRMLEKAHHFSSNIYGEDFDRVYDLLKSTNSFEEVRNFSLNGNNENQKLLNSPDAGLNNIPDNNTGFPNNKTKKNKGLF